MTKSTNGTVMVCSNTFPTHCYSTVILHVFDDTSARCIRLEPMASFTHQAFNLSETECSNIFLEPTPSFKLKPLTFTKYDI